MFDPFFQKATLTCAGFTNRGDRDVNEDSTAVFSYDGKECFMVCDGLGGHGLGDIASALAVQTFREVLKKGGSPESFLKDAFRKAQERLLSEQERTHTQKKMKTTVTCLVTDKKKAYIGYIGDSRVYVFSEGRVLTRTLDHSIPQMLVTMGDIKEEEIRHHKDRNILLRVMGIDWEDEQFELLKPIPLRKCDAFLLCSDGFWELIEENKMCELISASESAQEWMDHMVEEVQNNGEGSDMDNYSAIAVFVSH